MSKKNDMVCQFITDHRDEYLHKFPDQWMLTEHVFGKIAARHIIHLGCEYRSRVSYSYFTDRELERGYGKKYTTSKDRVNFHKAIPKLFGNSEHRALVALLDDARAVAGEIYTYYDNISIFEHDSIWEFYKAIGYDYKKQKYLKE